jgi:outer membrane receptor protein involved in Fe transport
MKRLIMTAVVAATLAPGFALAASNPIGGAVENFITVRPPEGVPDPRSYGGTSNCKAASADAWWGRFAGGGTSSGRSSGGSQLQTGEGCFPSRGACLTWLRAMKTQFSFQPVYNQCREGYQPGASVPPWWSPQSD